MGAKIVSLVFSLFFFAVSYGQNVHSYELDRRNGHLFMTAAICGESCGIMVESGIPALLIGQDFYERALAGGDLVFEPSQARIRLLNNMYEITYKANGALQIGLDKYCGPIFILKGFDGISLPVQNLYGESGRRTVSVDILNGRLSIGEAAENTGKCYKLHLDKKTGFPVVKAKMAISSQGNKAVLKGNLIVDFGNPMLAFLMSQHRSVSNAIRKGKIIPRDARDANGNVVAQGIYADAVTVCGQEYDDVSIGLTGKMNAIKEMGFLGLPFFNSAVAFDFDEGRMFVH
ncbi:MAG: hypothetical protein KBT00_02835 [Bacteroidales bacterium]|nr:hypothetical protein [Candidatus Cacconaster merdequi]